MATLYNAAPGTNFATFNPVSAALANLPNGAGTIAALIGKDNAIGTGDLCGLVAGAATLPTDWFHALHSEDTRLSDDDGLVAQNETPTWSMTTNWYIMVVTWPAGGAALERYHHVNQTSPAGWTHSPSGGNNGGNRAGPTTANGRWRIGHFGDESGSFGIALSAAWAGVQLSDAQCAELSVNNKTSDWWNNSGGHPTTLIECTSLTLTDIGANPSTFSSIGGLTLTNPAGGAVSWTFDGQGTPVVAGTPDRRMAQRHSRGTSW